MNQGNLTDISIKYRQQVPCIANKSLIAPQFLFNTWEIVKATIRIKIWDLKQISALSRTPTTMEIIVTK